MHRKPSVISAGPLATATQAQIVPSKNAMSGVETKAAMPKDTSKIAPTSGALRANDLEEGSSQLGHDFILPTVYSATPKTSRRFSPR